MADAAEPTGTGVWFDTRVRHPARVYDYLLGGKDNFEADRTAAEFLIANAPVLAAGARAQRAFLARAVHYLAAQAGIWQFLDIGTGLPSADNTHEVAQRAAPQARVVYVDNDPMVLLHARALLTSAPGGVTGYVDADARDTATILAEAARILDFRRPVAVMLLGVLHSIPEEDDPYAIVRRLAAAAPPGSHVVIAQVASDVLQRATDTIRGYNQFGGIPVTPRTHAQVSRFFDGLDLLEPGVTQVHRWRPGTGLAGLPRQIPIYGGVARKA